MFGYPFAVLTNPDQSQLQSFIINSVDYKLLLRQGFPEIAIRRVIRDNPYASIDRIRSILLGLQISEMKHLLKKKKMTVPLIRRHVKQYKEQKRHSHVDFQEFRLWLMMKELVRDHPYLTPIQLNQMQQLFAKYPDVQIDLQVLRHIDDPFQLRRRVRMLLCPKQITIAQKEKTQVKYRLDSDEMMKKLMKKWNKESRQTLQTVVKIIQKPDYKSLIKHALTTLGHEAPPTLNMILELIHYLETKGLANEEEIRRCIIDIFSMIPIQHAKEESISSRKQRQFTQDGEMPRIAQIRQIMTPAQIQDNVIRETQQIIRRYLG